MLESLNLPDGFVHISPDRRRQHLISLKHAFRVDNEPAPGLDACILVVDAVYRSYLASGI